VLHHDPLFSGQLQEATRPFLLGIDSDCARVMLHRRHIRVVSAHLTEADYSTSVSFASRGSAPCRADPHDAGPRAADNHAMVGSVLLVEDDNLVRAALAAGLAHPRQRAPRRVDFGERMSTASPPARWTIASCSCAMRKSERSHPSSPSPTPPTTDSVGAIDPVVLAHLEDMNPR